jgi:hypothetical protein
MGVGSGGERDEGTEEAGVETKLASEENPADQEHANIHATDTTKGPHTCGVIAPMPPMPPAWPMTGMFVPLPGLPRDA